MMQIIDNNTISINRGDIGVIHFSTYEEDGSLHTFQVNDVIRFSVKEKYSDSQPVLRKDIPVTEEEITSVDITLSKEDTTIGTLIDRPKKYVYDIAINEDETVIGYDKDGAKYFILNPEASNDE